MIEKLTATASETWAELKSASVDALMNIGGRATEAIQTARVWVASEDTNEAAAPALWMQSDTFQVWLGAMIVSVLLLAAYLVVKRLTTVSYPTTQDLKRLTHGPKLLGIAAILGLVSFVGGWSALAPLASATMAPGVVSPEGSRKTVEHLEGGIVRSIHVREGDSVDAGAPLVTLEDVQARAHLAQLRKRYTHLVAIEARLIAEQTGMDTVLFPEELLSADDVETDLAMTSQLDLFLSKRAAHAGRTRVLDKRIEQLNVQNQGLADVLSAQDRQIDLIEQEVSSVQELLDNGLERLPRLLALKRAQADLEARQATNRARIAENEERIGETELHLLSLTEQIVENASDELAETQRILGEIRSQLPSREDILLRTVVRAPLSGTVMNIQPTTETGVIRPGAPILEIVPAETQLVVDAKVRPSDIDRVRSGMEARVVLTAYRQRNLPLIHGTLRSISADRLVEDRTGEAYYLAKIDVDKGDLARMESVRLVPGMPAEVMLLDKEQTFFEYLISPLTQSFDRSFREQ